MIRFFWQVIGLILFVICVLPFVLAFGLLMLGQLFEAVLS